MKPTKQGLGEVPSFSGTTSESIGVPIPPCYTYGNTALDQHVPARSGHSQITSGRFGMTTTPSARPLEPSARTPVSGFVFGRPWTTAGGQSSSISYSTSLSSGPALAGGQPSFTFGHQLGPSLYSQQSAPRFTGFGATSNWDTTTPAFGGSLSAPSLFSATTATGESGAAYTSMFGVGRTATPTFAAFSTSSMPNLARRTDAESAGPNFANISPIFRRPLDLPETASRSVGPTPMPSPVASSSASEHAALPRIGPTSIPTFIGEPDGGQQNSKSNASIISDRSPVILSLPILAMSNPMMFPQPAAGFSFVSSAPATSAYGATNASSVSAPTVIDTTPGVIFSLSLPVVPVAAGAQAEAGRSSTAPTPSVRFVFEPSSAKATSETETAPNQATSTVTISNVPAPYVIRVDSKARSSMASNVTSRTSTKLRSSSSSSTSSPTASSSASRSSNEHQT